MYLIDDIRIRTGTLSPTVIPVLLTHQIPDVIGFSSTSFCSVVNTSVLLGVLLPLYIHSLL